MFLLIIKSKDCRMTIKLHCSSLWQFWWRSWESFVSLKYSFRKHSFTLDCVDFPLRSLPILMWIWKISLINCQMKKNWIVLSELSSCKSSKVSFDSKATPNSNNHTIFMGKYLFYLICFPLGWLIVVPT